MRFLLCGVLQQHRWIPRWDRRLGHFSHCTRCGAFTRTKVTA